MLKRKFQLSVPCDQLTAFSLENYEATIKRKFKCSVECKTINEYKINAVFTLNLVSEVDPKSEVLTSDFFFDLDLAEVVTSDFFFDLDLAEVVTSEFFFDLDLAEVVTSEFFF